MYHIQAQNMHHLSHMNVSSWGSSSPTGSAKSSVRTYRIVGKSVEGAMVRISALFIEPPRTGGGSDDEGVDDSAMAVACRGAVRT